MIMSWTKKIKFPFEFYIGLCVTKSFSEVTNDEFVRSKTMKNTGKWDNQKGEWDEMERKVNFERW